MKKIITVQTKVQKRDYVDFINLIKLDYGELR